MTRTCSNTYLLRAQFLFTQHMHLAAHAGGGSRRTAHRRHVVPPRSGARRAVPDPPGGTAARQDQSRLLPAPLVLRGRLRPTAGEGGRRGHPPRGLELHHRAVLEGRDPVEPELAQPRGAIEERPRHDAGRVRHAPDAPGLRCGTDQIRIDHVHQKRTMTEALLAWERRLRCFK